MEQHRGVLRGDIKAQRGRTLRAMRRREGERQDREGREKECVLGVGWRKGKRVRKRDAYLGSPRFLLLRRAEAKVSNGRCGIRQAEKDSNGAAD